ncbi:hypothetical protein BDV12DRAFT_190579 [Aspergillus spectabilis]
MLQSNLDLMFSELETRFVRSPLPCAPPAQYTSIPNPHKIPPLTVPDGWTIQKPLVTHDVANGNRVVMQVAFGLDQPYYGGLKGPNVTVADVIAAIDVAIPAIEIIDSHKRLTELTPGDTRGYLQFNGKEVISGNTGYVLGNPLNAVAWLANRLAEWDVEFQPGQVNLPGSCLQAVPMVEGRRWRCVFEG